MAALPPTSSTPYMGVQYALRRTLAQENLATLLQFNAKKHLLYRDPQGKFEVIEEIDTFEAEFTHFDREGWSEISFSTALTELEERRGEFSAEETQAFRALQANVGKEDFRYIKMSFFRKRSVMQWGNDGSLPKGSFSSLLERLASVRQNRIIPAAEEKELEDLQHTIEKYRRELLDQPSSESSDLETDSSGGEEKTPSTNSPRDS